jgi:glycosyltransferase involved in cell wall biosynthesis
VDYPARYKYAESRLNFKDNSIVRCAIVHYWLLGMRGGEKVVESLCRLFPEADIFTLFYDPEQVSETIRSHRVEASFLNPFRRYYRSLLPVMPMALEWLDLRGYDLVISSESGPAKGILTSSNTRHVCYCHSPMRYLWDLYPAYLHDWTRSSVKRALMAPLTNYLRMWDFAAAARVDEFVANSRNVQNRILKAYRRESEVIYPPVAVEDFYNAEPEDYYLIVSELVAYKCIAYAVQWFSRTHRRLKIVGDGPEYQVLRGLAGDNIEFCGRVSQDDLCRLYSRCRAVLMPGEEDFGIATVEALASGKPVIALGRGGVLESAPEYNPRAGFFYRDANEHHLERAVVEFEREERSLVPSAIQECATRFSERSFQREMSRLLLGPGIGVSERRFDSPTTRYLQVAGFTKA